MTFFARRMLLCVSLVFYQSFFWGQLVTQYLSTITVIIVLLSARPMKTSFSNKKEVFNELCTLFFLYCLQCFTDWIPDNGLSHDIGTAYIVSVIIFGVIHIVMLLFNVFRSLYRLIWRCCRRRKLRKVHIQQKPRELFPIEEEKE